MKNYFIIYIFLLCSCKDCVIINTKKPEKNKKEFLEKNEQTTNTTIAKDSLEKNKELENLNSLNDFEKYFNDFDSTIELLKLSKNFSLEQKDLLAKAIKNFAYKNLDSAQNFLRSVGHETLVLDEEKSLQSHKEYLIDLMDDLLNNADVKVRQQIFDIERKGINQILQVMLLSKKVRHSIIRNLNFGGVSEEAKYETFEKILNSNIVKNLFINNVQKSEKQGIEAAFLIFKTLQKMPIFITYPQYINSILNASLYKAELADRVIELCKNNINDKDFKVSLVESDLLNKYKDLELNQEQLEWIEKIKEIINDNP